MTLVSAALPALSGSEVSYNKAHNIFLTNGYTSAAGNTYFRGIRLNDRLIVTYSFGQGYLYLFLNGISLFCYDGKEKKLISSESYNCCCFSEKFAANRCIDMLHDYLASQAKMLGKYVSDQELKDFSTAMIDSVLKNNPPQLR